jgi:hypothetical protein
MRNRNHRIGLLILIALVSVVLPASAAENKKSRWNLFGGITDAILDAKEDFQSTADYHIDAVANLTAKAKETKNIISEATEEIGKTREMANAMVAMLFNKESVEAVAETQTVSVTTAKVLERTISDEDAARVINAMDAEQRGTYDMLPPELQGQVLAMIAQNMPEGE